MIMKSNKRLEICVGGKKKKKSKILEFTSSKNNILLNKTKALSRSTEGRKGY